MSPPLWNFSFSTPVTLKKLGQSHQIKSVLCYVQIIYPWKFGKNPTNGSQVTVQTRTCDANTKGDAKGIHTEISMSSSP